MSLGAALSSALSGLTANSRAAGLVASNIANATTESYGRRSLDLSSRALGSSGGVWIDGVSRNVDTAVLADRPPVGCPVRLCRRDAELCQPDRVRPGPDRQRGVACRALCRLRDGAAFGRLRPVLGSAPDLGGAACRGFCDPDQRGQPGDPGRAHRCRPHRRRAGGPAQQRARPGLHAQRGDQRQPGAGWRSLVADGSAAAG